MRHQWHLPRMYNLSPEVLFGGYDGSGNFFVDGKLSGTTPFLYELPKGASGFENVTLNVTLADPGNIEWDGKDLAVGDNQNLLIHRFAISGTQVAGGITDAQRRHFGPPVLDPRKDPDRPRIRKRLLHRTLELPTRRFPQ